MKYIRPVSTSILLLFVLISCNRQEPIQMQADEMEIAVLRNNDAFLQIESVEIGEYTGDRSGRGELMFNLYVVRQNDSVLQLIAPEGNTYSASGSSKIDFLDVGLRIDEIAPGEVILIYVFVFDRVPLEIFHNRRSVDALSEGGIVLADGFAKGLLSGRSISHTSLRTFIMTQLSDSAREWWQEADILGGYAWAIEPDAGWLEGNPYIGRSDNNNVEFQLKITSAEAFVFSDATPTVEPTMTGTPVEPAIIEITPRPTYVVGENFECEDAFDPRLEIGGDAKVVVYQVTVRRLPGLFSAPLNYFARDRILLVENGPVCLDGLYWWKVESGDLGYSGWVVEADDENYFLEPESE